MGKSRADRFVCIFGYQHFPGSGLPLQPRGDVDAVADHGVVAAIGRAHVGRQRRAGSDPDAHAQDKFAVQRCVDAFYFFLNPKCRVDRTNHVVVVFDGDVEKGYDSVAQQTVHDSMLRPNDSGTRLEKFLRNWRQLFDPKLLRETSVFPAIGEKHR